MATQRLGSRSLSKFLPRRSTLYVAAAMVVTELLVVAWYLALSGRQVLDPLTLVYPLVWIDVGLLAIWRTTPPPTSTRRRRIATVVAVGYAAVIAYTGGVVGPGYELTGAPAPPGAFSANLVQPPGFSPTVVYSGAYLHVIAIPFKLVGYAALVYLVYATVLDAAGSAISGVLGLFSCVSCSWPIVASVLTGAAGAGTAATMAGYMPSYKLSTLIFVVTVGLLYWRPIGRRGVPFVGGGSEDR